MTSYPSDHLTPRVTPEYDALAELFLGADAPAPARIEAKPAPRPADPPLRLAGVEPDLHSDEPPAPARDAAVIDAVILGSLPVYASAWLLQHARDQSQKDAAPVALVRTLSGECSVDVVGIAPGDIPKDAMSSLDAALAFVAASCARVLLRTGETSEHDLASHPAVGAITILTGVDDPALVAAYRTVKAIHSCEKPIRIATMGAPEADARRAFDKISRAAGAFLETPVEFAGHVEKIEPAPSVCLHRGASRVSLESLLDSIRSRPVPVSPPDPEYSTDENQPSDAAPEPDAPRDPPALATDAPTPDDAPSHARAPAPIVEQTPTLASRVKGLALTPIKAPGCARVEIAVDAAGRVHLLLEEQHDEPRAGGVAELLAAGAWARTNASLLATACATLLGAPVDETAAPSLHLFTSDPRRVRPLLDADIRLHFLGRVEIDGRRAWCVAELN